jgi:hypothetical protein
MRRRGVAGAGQSQRSGGGGAARSPADRRGRADTARAVDILIFRLRGKLGRAGYDCIETIRFVGYRFVPRDRVP